MDDADQGLVFPVGGDQHERGIGADLVSPEVADGSRAKVAVDQHVHGVLEFGLNLRVGQQLRAFHAAGVRVEPELIEDEQGSALLASELFGLCDVAGYLPAIPLPTSGG